MLSTQDLQNFISSPDFDRKEKWQEDIIKRRDVYFGMSLHMDGACPYWISLRDPRLGWIPSNYMPVRPLMGWMGYEYHWIFDLQLFNRYPTEQELIRNWRYSNYKPKQKAYFDNCVQMLQGAIFQDSGYSITMTEEEDSTFIWGENFTVSWINGTKTNFANFFSLNLKNICSDPNGFFLMIPKEENKEPDIWFIGSEQLRYISKDEIIFKKQNMVWVVNRVGYFRWEKRGDKWEMIDPEGYYAHMLGYMPAIVAGGILNTNYYESWLQAAKPIADDLVIAMSDEAMCAKQASFPFISEVDRDCPDCQRTGLRMRCSVCKGYDDTCDCESGHNHWDRATCITCNGTGGLGINPGERLRVPKADMELDQVKVVNIPVDANKMHQERVEKLKMDLQKSLHLNYIDQAQSGVAKDKDMETRYQFMVSITNDIFGRLMPFCLNTILSLKKVTVTESGVVPYVPLGNDYDYTLKPPSQFQIKTSYDLLEDLKMAKEGEIPAYQKGALLEDYVDKQFGGNDILKRKTCLINQLDKLANKSFAEISTLVVGGAASNRDWQFSVSLPTILDQINRDKGTEWFLTTSYDDISRLAKQIFNTTNPELPGGTDFIEERIEA